MAATLYVDKSTNFQVAIQTSNHVRTVILKSVLGLLPLILCSAGARAQQKLAAPTCEVRFDLQYKLHGTAHVTLAGQMDVPPPTVKFIMGAAGEDHWNEVTKHGKK